MLERDGVPKEKIILEEKANSTVNNAIKCIQFEIFYKIYLTSFDPCANKDYYSRRKKTAREYISQSMKTSFCTEVVFVRIIQSTLRHHKTFF